MENASTKRKGLLLSATILSMVLLVIAIWTEVPWVAGVFMVVAPLILGFLLFASGRKRVSSDTERFSVITDSARSRAEFTFDIEPEMIAKRIQEIDSKKISCGKKR